MAADQENPDRLWGAISLTQQLHRLSRHPVVLLTDIRSFPDGAPVGERLRLMGVDVRYFPKDAAPGSGLSSGDWLKLQAWNLTEFEKVIWIEADSIAYRGIDWLFEREQNWAARSDPDCTLQATSTDSSLMLLYPNAADAVSLIARASKEAATGIDKAISGYFADTKRWFQWLGELDANSGNCLSNAIPTPYRNLDGSPPKGAWSVPAVVHRSGRHQKGEGDQFTSDNVCFSMHLDEQVFAVAGQMQNVCHKHPLASFWRDSFCLAAVHILNVKQHKVADFCNDSCYYKGQCEDSRVLEVKQ